MTQIITEEQIWQALPVRRATGHKGSFGRVLALAGSRHYRGAAALAVEGILRGGAGLVTLASVEEVAPVVLGRLPEAMLLSCTCDAAGGISADELPRLLEFAQGCDTLLMGPGMGDTPDTLLLVQRLTKAMLGTVVLDADALNVLSRQDTLPHPAEGALIITPHPGEMARLCGCTIGQIQQNREAAAVGYAQSHHCIVVLKGPHTLIASPDGCCLENPTGNAGLARGGSGDALAGLIAAFAAQVSDPLWAAAAGVYLHGAAADACAAELGQYGMLPHDLFYYLGRIFARSGR